MTNTSAASIQIADLHYNFKAPLDRLTKMSKNKCSKAVIGFYSRHKNDASYQAEVHLVWPCSVDDWEEHAAPPTMGSDDDEGTPLNIKRNRPRGAGRTGKASRI